MSFVPVFGKDKQIVWLKEKMFKAVMKSLKSAERVDITAEGNEAIFSYTTSAGKGEMRIYDQKGMVR